MDHGQYRSVILGLALVQARADRQRLQRAAGAAHGAGADLSASLIAIIALGAVVAGFVQGLSGFAFGMVAHVDLGLVGGSAAWRRCSRCSARWSARSSRR